MPSLTTPRELRKWVPGKVLSASDALGWKDVGQRTYRYVGQDVAVPGIDHFTIVRYCVGATRMERRFDGRWTRTHCAPGDLSLLTRSQGSHWHWTEDIDVSHVYLSEPLASRIASDVMQRSLAEVQLHDVLRTQDATLTGHRRRYYVRGAPAGHRWRPLHRGIPTHARRALRHRDSRVCSANCPVRSRHYA